MLNGFELHQPENVDIQEQQNHQQNYNLQLSSQSGQLKVNYRLSEGSNLMLMMELSFSRLF
jgi:hypothetical protein